MFAVVVSLALIQLALVQSCPDILERYDTDPSYCLEENPDCNILKRGVTGDEKDLILNLHNKYRNNIAEGSETRGGGLPSASNMLKMVWDDELAKEAEGWAVQCKDGHDCKSTCRERLDYAVGQNIGKDYNGPHSSANWTYIMGLFYEEITKFNPSVIPSYRPGGYGHFTQVIWANSWRIGCAWILYGDDDEDAVDSRRYVCDYGPTGNIGDTPVYEEGTPCSGCPENSRCGGDIDSEYPALCQMNDNNTAPVYEVDLSQYNFYCDFRNESDDDSRRRRDASTVATVKVDSSFFDDDSSDSDDDDDDDDDTDSEDDSDDESDGGDTGSDGGDTGSDGSAADDDDGNSCAYSTSGSDKWEVIPTLGGNILSCILKGGESSTISFKHGITAPSPHCLNVRYRMAPNKAGDQDAGSLKLGYTGLSDLELGPSADYVNYHYGSLPEAKNAKISLIFSVPSGAQDQYVNVQMITDKSPKC